MITRSIALVGPMGAGKSAVAHALGERLGVRVEDLDRRIERASGRTIREWFDIEGEERFRVMEAETLAAVLDEGVAVIACGGGIVVRPDNRARLRERCDTVWLDVDAGAALARIGAAIATRPLLAGNAPGERLESLARERGPAYAEVARARIDTTGRAIDDVAADILRILELT